MSTSSGAPAAGALRFVRAAVLGTVAMGLAAGAHAAGGGAVPALPVLVLLGIPVGLLAVAVTARRLTGSVLVAVLGIAQVGLHLALARIEPMSGCLPVGGGGHAGHGATSLSAACSELAGTSAMAMPMSASMLLTHAVATLITAWVLARGEALLWRAVRSLAPRLPSAPLLPGAPGSRVSGTPLALSGLAVRGSSRPRGPPRLQTA